MCSLQQGLMSRLYQAGAHAEQLCLPTALHPALYVYLRPRKELPVLSLHVGALTCV